MTWHASEPVSSVEAGDIIASARFTHGYAVDVVVAFSSEGPRSFILRIKRANNQISRSIEIPSPGGFWVSPTLPQIHMSNDEALEVLTATSIPHTESVQATIFTKASG